MPLVYMSFKNEGFMSEDFTLKVEHEWNGEEGARCPNIINF